MSLKANSAVPGLEPTSDGDGNLSDIARAGSLHEFLLDLHKQFGPIASFWRGKLYVVSIASAELFEEHQNIFDRPPELFELFKPVLGERSIQYANKEEGRARRKHYEKALNRDAVKRFFPKIQEVADEIAAKWETQTGGTKLSLKEQRSIFSLKAVLQTLFGEHMKDDGAVMAFRKAYGVVWGEMEHRLTKPTTEEGEKEFQEAMKVLQETIQQILKDRKASPPKHETMLDYILSYTDDETTQFSDAMSFTVGGYHTTGNLLLWALYFVAKHPEVDKKIHDEIQTVLGDKNVDDTNMRDLVTDKSPVGSKSCPSGKVSKLQPAKDFQENGRLGDRRVKLLLWIDSTGRQSPDPSIQLDPLYRSSIVKTLRYLRQVLDETLRCSVVAPWGARFQDTEASLGGYTIPKGTPVIHALGVAFKNEKAWPNPERFDPERFSSINLQNRSKFWFSPFGFAGNRTCPAEDYAYAEATVAMVTLLRKFKVHLADEPVTPEYGFVTHPKEDIWISLTKR